jgi:hypothetical protein
MNNNLFIAYLKDTEELLIEGETVLAFFDYQLQALKDIFKDNLTYFKDSNDWYRCKLKDPTFEIRTTNRRNDVTFTKVQKLYDQGLSAEQIARKFGCSTNLIYDRLYKGE